MEIKIAPSILSCDFSRLEEEVKKVEEVADLLHIDVMDGHFVPNLTVGPQVVESLKKRTSLPLDVHLMVENPEKWVEVFLKVGIDFLSFHVEATHHPIRLLEKVKEKGRKVGLALNPSTPLSRMEWLFSLLDFVLLMTVDPGFGAQEFLPSALSKIKRLREKAKKRNFPLDIEVDGGINLETCGKVVSSGANILIAGSFIFHSPSPPKRVLELREKALKERT